MAEKVKATQQEIDEALELLRRTKEQRAKQRDRIKNDPSLKAKQQERTRRRMAKDRILIQKALKAGIVVTDKEIDDAMKAVAK